MPLVIGLTGSIAAGKSTVAQILVDNGAVHCDADKLVLPPTTTDFVARLCRAGEHVTYHRYPHIDHGLVGERTVPLLIPWLDDALAGKPQATTCAS